MVKWIWPMGNFPKIVYETTQKPTDTLGCPNLTLTLTLNAHPLLEIGDGCELGITTLIVMLNFIVAMAFTIAMLLVVKGPVLRTGPGQDRGPAPFSSSSLTKTNASSPLINDVWSLSHNFLPLHSPLPHSQAAVSQLMHWSAFSSSYSPSTEFTSAPFSNSSFSITSSPESNTAWSVFSIIFSFCIHLCPIFK